MSIRVYRSALGYGLFANVEPDTPRATVLLEYLEPIIERCHHCGEPAVRVGVFGNRSGKGEEPECEFRGLCERHKQFGKWDGPDVAWGWT